MRAIIIGGGIGGLTAAIALRWAGIEAAVYERAPEPREVGAGISVWSNALAALRTIDALGPVLARGEVVRLAEVRSWRGRVLQSSSAAAMDPGQGVPVILMIHRAELLEALLEQLPAGVVRFGHECTGASEDGAGAHATFAPGAETGRAEGDLLIGADGISSAVRRSLRGREPHRYSGYTCWRGVAVVPESLVAAGYVAECWGRGARFGITRIGQGRIYWWATRNTPEGGRDGDTHADLRRIFGAWAEPVPSIIGLTPAGAIIRNDIVDRPPIRGWGRGRVTLLGDAAHPTTPNLGQGGCMAIEDGVVLAHLLRGTADIPGTLREYERRRAPRTARITRDSWRFGRPGQWENTFLCWARDTTTSLLPERLVAGQQRALMRFEL
jgi:2-polyprenyl-6-methoxyphenol hydroxylase-like FAD-dependent oxidoreductase